MRLDERKQRVLRAIVQDYIATAEPVGSRTIARRYLSDYSAATIRNEMADLEEMGFLGQPHTSAGRIPSDKGYRFYVDFLMDLPALNDPEAAWIKQSFATRMKAMEQIIQQTAHVLASITHYTSVVLGPQTNQSAFLKMQLMEVSPGQALAVIITDTGLVANRMLVVPPHFSQEQLNQVSAFVNRRFRGRTFGQLQGSVLRQVEDEISSQIASFDEIIDLLVELLRPEHDERVYLGGTTHILNQPEFQDMERVKSLLSLLDQEELMRRLVSQCSEAERVRVTIGQENPYEGVSDCSLVTAVYRIHGRPVGSIGVLGPTRMDYAKVVAVVNEVTGILNEILDRAQIF
ncbi:MAG: heat-inducible transcriptional repressor HrcA [Bacillota bacterium]